MKRCRLKRYNFQMKTKMSKENKTSDNAQNGNDFIADVSVAKRPVYCECSQKSLMKPISPTEYECFDCGKEVKQ